MYKYEEKTHSANRSEKPAASRKFLKTDKPAQFKLADEQMHSKLVQCFKARPIIQMIRYDAGVGGNWHVHKDHVKHGDDETTKVDFKDLTTKQILKSLGGVVRARPDLKKDPFSQACLRACRRYIRRYVGKEPT